MTVTGSNTPVLRGGSGELFHDPSFLAFIEVLSKKHAADNLRDMGYGREGENAAALTQSLLRFQLDFGIPRTGILDGVSMGTLNAVRSNREFLQSCEAASGEHYRTVHVTRTVDPGSSTFYRVQALGFKPLLVDTPTQIVDAIRNTRRGGPETVYMVVAGPAPERDVQALRWSLELLASKVPIVLTEDEHAAVGSLSLQQQLLLPNQGRRTFTAIGPLAVHSLGLPERTFQLKSGNGVLRLKVTGIWRESVDQLIAIFQWLFNRNSGLDSLSTAAILQEGLKAFAEKTQTDPHRLGVWVYAETTGAQVAVREAEEPRTGILTSCGLGCVCGCPKVDSRPAIRQLGSRASSDSGKPQ